MSAFARLALMNPSPELGSTVLFLARGVPYTVDDAVAAALFRGSLDRVLSETLELAAAEERAEDEDFEPDEDILQARSESFRYERDLITAGETEDWLDARALTMDDFSAWLYQQVCAENVDVSQEELPVPEDFPRLLRVHLWMSDGMTALSTDLSRRVAAGLEISERGETPPAEPVMQRFLEQHNLNDQDLSRWLEALGRDRTWLSEMAGLEAAYHRMVSRAVTEDARGRLLPSVRLALGRVEIETLELDSETAAREAFLCVRDDGMTLRALAEEAGYRSERAGMWLDMVDESLGPRLLGAAEGDVIGPIALQGRFKVCQVLRKLPPTLSDPAVCQRLDKMIIDQYFADLCARHIQVPAASPAAK